MAEKPEQKIVEPDPQGKTFTQEDLDRVAGKVRAEEKAKLGDVEKDRAELARLKSEQQAREEAEKSEHQKALDAAKKETEKTLRAEFDAREKRIKLEGMIEREFLMRGVDPDAKLFLLQDGKYKVESEDKVKEMVETLLADKKYLAEGATPLPIAVGGTPSTSRAAGIVQVPIARMEELSAQGKWIGSKERDMVQSGQAELV